MAAAPTTTPAVGVAPPPPPATPSVAAAGPVPRNPLLRIHQPPAPVTVFQPQQGPRANHIAHLLSNRRRSAACQYWKPRLQRWAETRGFSDVTPLQRRPTVKATIALDFSADGRLLASTHGDHTVKLWSYPDMTLLQALPGHQRTPWSVRFHPTDYNVVASGCLSTRARQADIIVWDLAAGKAKHRAVVSDHVMSMAFHPTLPLLLCAAGASLVAWDYTDTSKPPVAMARFPSSLRCVEVLPCGTGLVTGVEATSEGHLDAANMVVELQRWDLDAAVARALPSTYQPLVVALQAHRLPVVPNAVPVSADGAGAGAGGGAGAGTGGGAGAAVAGAGAGAVVPSPLSVTSAAVPAPATLDTPSPTVPDAAAAPSRFALGRALQLSLSPTPAAPMAATPAGPMPVHPRSFNSTHFPISGPRLLSSAAVLYNSGGVCVSPCSRFLATCVHHNSLVPQPPAPSPTPASPLSLGANGGPAPVPMASPPLFGHKFAATGRPTASPSPSASPAPAPAPVPSPAEFRQHAAVVRRQRGSWSRTSSRATLRVRLRNGSSPSVSPAPAPPSRVFGPPPPTFSRPPSLVSPPTMRSPPPPFGAPPAPLLFSPDTPASQSATPTPAPAVTTPAPAPAPVVPPRVRVVLLSMDAASHGQVLRSFPVYSTSRGAHVTSVSLSPCGGYTSMGLEHSGPGSQAVAVVIDNRTMTVQMRVAAPDKTNAVAICPRPGAGFCLGTRSGLVLALVPHHTGRPYVSGPTVDTGLAVAVHPPP